MTLSSQPQRSTELMAYLRLLVGEAQRRGGSGWLEYDRLFRAQAAANPAKAWSALDLALFPNSFLAEKYRPARAPPSCEYCLEADHATEDCALAPTSDVVYRKSKEKGQSSESNSVGSCSISGRTVAPTGPVASSCMFVANAAWRGTRQARASRRRRRERRRRSRPSGVFLSLRSRPLWGVG